ncbi:MAG: N-acetylneuraminate synthase family protein [Kordiimonadaceae bacterium]|nr:N-acetylneuraminate synthase family protein [Kordiimonadaceae bacterium]
MADTPFFIAEVSSNHAGDLGRCIAFIKKAAEIGCDAVKFQLFRVDELFAPEILVRSEEHRSRREWELPLEFLPELAAASKDNGIQFCCTPFYMAAVEHLYDHVDFYKIASYELPWDGLIEACAKTGKRLILSTGMATLPEIEHAAKVFYDAGGTDLELLHCVSGYPVLPAHCNLAAIETIRAATRCTTGWSDHSRNSEVVRRAVGRWAANTVEFHLDMDEQGAEYAAGHCWLPDEIAPVIAACAAGVEGLKSTAKVPGVEADGDGVKTPTAAEIDDRPWRADPSDGLRPTVEVRAQWAKK